MFGISKNSRNKKSVTLTQNNRKKDGFKIREVERKDNVTTP